MRIKKSELLGKSEKSFSETNTGTNRVKIDDLLSNKKITITRDPGLKEAEDEYRKYQTSRSFPTTQVVTKPVVQQTPIITTEAWDEDALRNNMAATRKEPSFTTKALGYVGSNLYNGVVKPIGQGIDKIYEKADDYNFGEKALNDAYATAVSNSQNVWDEDVLRTQRLINDRNKLLSYMTPEQKQQYNSLPENKKKDYLDSIMAELQSKSGAERAEEILAMTDKGNQAAQLMGLSFESGLSSAKSGLKGAYNLMRGADETVAKGASEYAFSTVRPNVKGAMGVAMDVGHTLGNMAPSMAAGVVAAPLGFASAGTALMGVSAAGRGYDEAIGQGYTPEKAAAYGVTSGIAEAALQKIVGALPGVSNAQGLVTRFLGKYGDDVLAKALSNPATRKAITTIIGNAASEGTEEGVQEAIDVLLRNTILGENNKLNLKDIGYSAALGAITGGTFAAPGGVNTFVNGRGNTEVTTDVETTPATVAEETKVPEAEVPDVEETAIQQAEIEPEEAVISDQVKQAARAVNPKAENSQQILRDIMRNNGHGQLIDTLDKVANKFNVELRLYADNTNSEGYYENGTVNININNLRDTADGIWKLAKHELTHFIEGTEGYGKLLQSRAAQDIFNNYLAKENFTFTTADGENLTGIEALNEIIKENYAKNGVELSPTDLQKEVVARLIEESGIFTSEESIRRLAEEDPGLIERIHRWIKDTIAKLRGGAETRQLMKLEKMYEKALSQAAKGEYLYNRGSDRQNLFVKENYNYRKMDAEKAERDGFSAEQIWNKYRLKRDSRGNWITEIDDSEAKFNPSKVTSGKLSDVFKHDVLYSIYPDAANINFEFKNLKGKKGSFNIYNKTLELDKKFKRVSNEEAAKTIIHELQHYLQYLEDRSVGGSRDAVYNYLMNRAFDTYENTAEFNSLKNYKQRVDFLENKIKEAHGSNNLEKILYEEYRTIEGEEEARAAADRVEKSAKERKKIYPEYGNKGIDWTETERKRELNKSFKNVRKLNPNFASKLMSGIISKKGGRVYDEGEVYGRDREFMDNLSVHRSDTDSTQEYSLPLAQDGSANVTQTAGKTSGRYTQTLQDGWSSEADTQDAGNQGGQPERSKINNNEGQAGNGLFFNAKNRQFEIINNSNPAADDYHTWIRSADEILTFEEAISDGDGDFTPDYTEKMAKEALKSGHIKVYSSYPIENGVFVTPSKMEAQNYAGSGKVYSKDVNINDVAWIDGIEGQYARVSDEKQYSFSEERELNKKSEQYLHRATNTLLNDFLEITEANKYADTRGIKKAINTFAEVSAKRGSVDREEANKLFDVLFSEALVKDAEAAERYGEAAQKIKNTKFYGGGLGSLEGRLRREYFGKIRLVTDPSATKIDSFYKELSENHPDIVDPEITNIEDQVQALANVVDEAQNTLKHLNEFMGSYTERAEKARGAFMESLDNFEQSISDVSRYTDSRDAKTAVKEARAEKVEAIRSDKEYAKSFFKDYTEARRAYDKAARKEMLTPEDTLIMKQLSDGLTTWEEVEKRADEFNLKAIKKVYDAFNAKYEFDKVAGMLRTKVVGEYRQLAEDEAANSDGWKDKKAGVFYSREVMERNIEDITKKDNGKNRRNADAESINKTYFKPVHENEAKSNRLKKEFVEKIKKLNLGTDKKYTVMFKNEQTGLPVQAKVSESGLVQLYGEKLIDDKILESVGADVAKVQNAVKEFRSIYNQLIELANDTLIRNGYRPVEYRKDYFPHFTENKADSLLGEIAGYFGIDIKTDELPTDIAGITHTFRPGKKWVGNFLERKTSVTDYDALKGFDRYLNGAADVIFHTDDIQRLRAFESELRYKYSDEGTRKRIREIENNDGLTAEQKQSLIEDIMKVNEVSHLPNLVTELRNYTDNLAGKKSISDRNWEHAMGRSFYNFMKKMENRVSANMVALNPGSWLTNFIPITQVSGIVSNKNLARAVWDASKSFVNSDGFADRSDFLVNRKGSEMTFKTKADKIQEKLTKPFEIIDSFSADVVTRALYYDQMAKTGNEAEALEYANDMAARVMADRSKGAKPTAFNSQNPIAKLVTMFQIEVNNQYSYLFKDLPAAEREKGKAALVVALVKVFLGAWLYNELYEKIAGRRAALDPADIVASAYKDFSDPNVKASQAIANTAANIADELPFVGSLLGGGRIPIQSALPSASKTSEAVTGLITGEMNSKKALQQLGKELIKPGAYLVPPVGGGQIKKAIEGISTVAQGGEFYYDNDGNKRLKYPIEDKTLGKYLQAGVFGKSALPESKAYYDNGMPTLSAKQTQNYYKAVEAGINYEQYMAALKSVRALESGKSADKKAAIDAATKDYGLNRKQKEILYEANNVSKSVW